MTGGLLILCKTLPQSSDDDKRAIRESPLQIRKGAYYKFKIIFSLQLGLATVWALGNNSIKLFWIYNLYAILRFTNV